MLSTRLLSSGSGSRGFGGGGGGTILGATNPFFIPYTSAANTLSDTINPFDAVTGNTGFGIAPARRIHAAAQGLNNAVVPVMRIDAVVSPVGAPLAGFGPSFEFMGKALISGADILLGSIEATIRAASVANGVAQININALEAGGTNRTMVSILPTQSSPSDNRVTIFAQTTLEMNGGGAGASALDFTIKRTDAPLATGWGVSVPVSLLDAGSVTRIAARMIFDWENHTTAYSRIYLNGMKAATAFPFQTWFPEKSGLYSNAPLAIFDIHDESALKTYPHVLFSSSSFTHGITSYLPANSWGGILCGASGSGYSSGGVILTTISASGSIPAFNLNCFFELDPATGAACFQIRTGVKSGTIIAPVAASRNLIYMFNGTDLILNVSSTGHFGIKTGADLYAILLMREDQNLATVATIRNDYVDVNANSCFQAQYGAGNVCTLRQGNPAYNQGGMFVGNNGFLFSVGGSLNVFSYGNNQVLIGTLNTARIAIEGSGEIQALTFEYYSGPYNVDSSYRTRVDGADFVFERREGGSWIEKSRILG